MLPNGNTTRLDPNHDSLFSNHVCLIISTSSTQSQQPTKTPKQSQLNQNTQTTMQEPTFHP